MLTIIPRSDIGLVPASRELDLRHGPATAVYVHHTGGPEGDPLATWRSAQKHAMSTHTTTAGVEAPHSDIDYSFGVTSEGKVLEGRGWFAVPAATADHNASSLAICVLGNFEESTPTASALGAVRDLIRQGFINGAIALDAQILGHRDVRNTACPGRHLYVELPGIRNVIHDFTWPPPTPKPTTEDDEMKVTYVQGNGPGRDSGLIGNGWAVYAVSPYGELLHITAKSAVLLRDLGVLVDANIVKRPQSEIDDLLREQGVTE